MFSLQTIKKKIDTIAKEAPVYADIAMNTSVQDVVNKVKETDIDKVAIQTNKVTDIATNAGIAVLGVVGTGVVAPALGGLAVGLSTGVATLYGVKTIIGLKELKKNKKL